MMVNPRPHTNLNNMLLNLNEPLYSSEASARTSRLIVTVEAAGTLICKTGATAQNLCLSTTAAKGEQSRGVRINLTVCTNTCSILTLLNMIF